MLVCNTCEKTEEEVVIIKSKMLCRSCNNREYYENNKEKLRKNNKENKENNKEKVREYNKVYYENNKEKLCRETETGKQANREHEREERERETERDRERDRERWKSMPYQTKLGSR